MRIQDAEPRGCDKHGCGHFHASRGSRLHNGTDRLYKATQGVTSLISGVVTKLGKPYADHLEYDYVEITKGDYRFRFFYVSPVVELGQVIKVDDLIGYCQDLDLIYQGIKNHVHFEIMNKDDGYIDPTPLLLALDEQRYG